MWKILIATFKTFPNDSGFSRPLERSLLKTSWIKEKLLVTSISSFSHNVFYPTSNLSFASAFNFVVCKYRRLVKDYIVHLTIL